MAEDGDGTLTKQELKDQVRAIILSQGNHFIKEDCCASIRSRSVTPRRISQRILQTPSRMGRSLRKR